MIEKNIVFVLGAGASIPFDYPSGAALVKRICNNLSNVQSHEFREIHECIQDANPIRDFRDQLFYSAQQSVDSFLEHRPEFMEIGKMAITQALIPFENHNRLFVADGTNWYTYLFRKLTTKTSFDNFISKNQIAFITFNYDRSLEHFLFTALKSTYGKNDSECSAVLNSISIIHVYGRLDYLQWQKVDGRAYNNSEYSAHILKKSAKEIHIITETEHDLTDFKRASDLLEKAEVIYFLGFGYNPTNLDRLNILSCRKPGPKPVFGTAYDLKPAERSNVKAYFKEMGVPLNLGDDSMDVLNFLRHYMKE